MADSKPVGLSMDSDVTEWLLGRIAHKLFPQYLERFATTLLRIEEAKYFHIVDDAGNDSWRRCFYVSVLQSESPQGFDLGVSHSLNARLNGLTCFTITVSSEHGTIYNHNMFKILVVNVKNKYGTCTGAWQYFRLIF